MMAGIKLTIFGAICVILGAIVGVSSTPFFQSSIGDMAVRDFRFSFERLGSRDGVPKSLTEMQRQEKDLLAIQTVGLGQAFNRITDEQLQTEAIRIIRLIEANPEFQAPLTNGMARWAADSRNCILAKFSDPSAVVTCVEKSRHAMHSSKPQRKQLASR